MASDRISISRGGTELPATLPPGRGRRRLDGATGVRRELVRVYWEARHGRLSLADACKLAFILTSIGRLLEVEVLERRIAALETLQAREDAGPALEIA